MKENFESKIVSFWSSVSESICRVKKSNVVWSEQDMYKRYTSPVSVYTVNCRVNEAHTVHPYAASVDVFRLYHSSTAHIDQWLEEKFTSVLWCSAGLRWAPPCFHLSRAPRHKSLNTTAFSHPPETTKQLIHSRPLSGCSVFTVLFFTLSFRYPIVKMFCKSETPSDMLRSPSESPSRRTLERLWSSWKCWVLSSAPSRLL